MLDQLGRRFPEGARDAERAINPGKSSSFVEQAAEGLPHHELHPRRLDAGQPQPPRRLAPAVEIQRVG
ncbi:hypothetical protein D3C73_668370 [compost metagenome]